MVGKKLQRSNSKIPSESATISTRPMRSVLAAIASGGARPARGPDIQHGDLLLAKDILRVMQYRSRVLAGLLIGLVAGIVAVGLASTPLFETWERRTLDLRSRLFADTHHADARLVAVVIDQRS